MQNIYNYINTTKTNLWKPYEHNINSFITNHVLIMQKRFVCIFLGNISYTCFGTCSCEVFGCLCMLYIIVNMCWYLFMLDSEILHGNISAQVLIWRCNTKIIQWITWVRTTGLEVLLTKFALFLK